MKKQKEFIHNTDWDNLIILDACRYDFFSKIYKGYLEGELRKLLSPARRTPQWLIRIFGGKFYREVVYVSANPHVNSKGVDVAGGFSADEHFYKIVDAWDSGWDDEMGTVFPDEVSWLTRKARASFPEKRIISHFMQPHHPYLSLPPGVSGSITRPRKEEKSFGKIRQWINSLLGKMIGKGRLRKALKALNLRDLGPVEKIGEEYGNDVLHEVYEENLRSVLEEVSILSERISGRTVVTSDHGELLGEGGHYKHPDWLDGFDSILRVVPWLELK